MLGRLFRQYINAQPVRMSNFRTKCMIHSGRSDTGNICFLSVMDDNDVDGANGDHTEM